MGCSLEGMRIDLSEPGPLDASVDEVFGMMLGSGCAREDSFADVDSISVTAVVGFAGALSGACILRTSDTGAMYIASQLTGMSLVEVDDMVKDAFGEICNMLAGTWKARLPGLAAQCALSVPAVITGHDYRLHMQAPALRLTRFYALEGRRFSVTILCDILQLSR